LQRLAINFKNIPKMAKEYRAWHVGQTPEAKAEAKAEAMAEAKAEAKVEIERQMQPQTGDETDGSFVGVNLNQRGGSFMANTPRPSLST